MNIFKAMAVKDVAEATRTIPVIDFAPAFRGEPGGLEAVAARVRGACESIGFFYLAGHGVSPRIVHAAFEASREFHALPLEEKLALKLNENNIGYLPVLARSLEMPEDFFAPFFADEAHINLRFLHYPPQEVDDDEQFGQGPHTDNSFFTMLAREDVPGLAVRLPSGEWLAPPVIDGTFLVNLGNVMKRWSNDRFLSTPHGVLNDSGRDRYSIAFFYSPNVDAAIECVPACVGAGDPARYPRAIYRDLVLEFYNANYFHRKSYAGATVEDATRPS